MTKILHCWNLRFLGENYLDNAAVCKNNIFTSTWWKVWAVNQQTQKAQRSEPKHLGSYFMRWLEFLSSLFSEALLWQELKNHKWCENEGRSECSDGAGFHHNIYSKPFKIWFQVLYTIYIYIWVYSEKIQTIPLCILLGDLDYREPNKGIIL